MKTFLIILIFAIVMTSLVGYVVIVDRSIRKVKKYVSDRKAERASWAKVYTRERGTITIGSLKYIFCEYPEFYLFYYEDKFRVPIVVYKVPPKEVKLGFRAAKIFPTNKSIEESHFEFEGRLTTNLLPSYYGSTLVKMKVDLIQVS